MKSAVFVLSCLAVWPACSKTDPLYCDEQTSCTAGLPACDLGGVCAESDHIGNTCIAVPCWDGAPVGSDGSPQTVDAGNADAPAQPDALPSLGPWGAPVKVTALSSPYNDAAPTISSDGLEVYVQRLGQVNGGNLIRSERDFVGGVWHSATGLLTGRAGPELSPSGDELFVVDYNTIHVYDRGATPTDWISGGELFPGLNPNVVKGGLVMYYRDGDLIVRRERPSLGGTWGSSQAVDLGTLDQFIDMAVSDDELLALVTAIDGGVLGLYETTRSNRGEAWGPLARVDVFDDFGTPALCDLLDKSRMFCQVNDVNGSGDIYYVERQ